MTLVNTETGEITEPLTAMERSELVHQEAAIEQGAAQVAEALTVIRDKRLYKEDYSTFEAYCRERWGMSKRNVDYKIVAGEVAGLLGTIVPTGQARELADLRDDPDRLRDTYKKAHEQTGGKVTAKAIRQVRREPQPAREYKHPETGEDVTAGEWMRLRDGAPKPNPADRTDDLAEITAQGVADDAERLHRLVTNASPQGKCAARSAIQAAHQLLTDCLGMIPDDPH